MAKEKKKVGADEERRGPGRPPREKEAIEFKDGLGGAGAIEDVLIKDIDLEDRRFQYRVREKVTDLIPSLISEGQLVPVILWGKERPFKIIDGYRRVTAISNIGWTSVKAIIRRDISEDDAYRLSFVENVKRKNFTPLDMANAVWKAQAVRNKSSKELAEEFSLSDRQIRRYKELIQFSDPIKEALLDESITMAHAQVFNSFGVKDPDAWIEKIGSGMSAQALKREFGKQFGKKRKQKMFFREEKDGFRLFPIRFSTNLSVKEQKSIIEVLEKALATAKKRIEGKIQT